MSIDDYDCIFCEKNTSVEEWKSRITEILRDRGQDNYIAFDTLTRKPVGWIGYENSNQICKLHIIVVHTDFLSKKYGYGMMEWLMKNVSNKANKIVLDVQDENVRDIRFYKKIGFEIIRVEMQPFGEGQMKYYVMELTINNVQLFSGPLF